MRISKYVVTLSYVVTYGDREVTHNEVIESDTRKDAEWEYERIDEMMQYTTSGGFNEYDTLEAELELTYQYGTFFTEVLAYKLYKKEGK